MKALFSLLAITFLFAGQLGAYEPEFKKGEYIHDGGSPINIYAYLAPTTVDWNNDGAKDLVCGQGIASKIFLFLNTGTDLNPVFMGYTAIQSGGVDIVTSNSNMGGSHPRVLDWNEDGMKDLLTGEGDGYIRVYLNTNTDADPIFNGYTLIQVAGGDYDCGDQSQPEIVDWNDDGKKDVVCGTKAGNVQLLINEGTNAAPVFNQAVKIQSGGSDINIGNIVCPAVGDLNRDGKKDLLLGDAWGRMNYFENMGTSASPIFQGSVHLEADGKKIDLDYTSKIDLVDWNNDGVLDLLASEYNTLPPNVEHPVWYFQGIGPMALDTNTVDASSGGTVNMSLDAGAVNGNRNYIIVGGVTGTEPGTPLPGGTTVLPVNWDVFTDIMMGLLNIPVFNNFLGTLDANGQALANLNAPPVPVAVGVVMSYAFAMNNPWDYASNGVNIEFVP